MAGIAARAHRDERQQPRIAGRVAARGGRDEAADLRQGVVEDVGQAVPVFDQVLDGVEPAAAVTGGSFAAANSPSSLGITVRVKKSAFTSITLAASRIASSAVSSSTQARGLPTAIAMADSTKPFDAVLGQFGRIVQL